MGVGNVRVAVGWREGVGVVEGEGLGYFDFEEVFGGPVDFFKGLLAGVGHGLHGG